jgi:hypothetical protein
LLYHSTIVTASLTDIFARAGALLLLASCSAAKPAPSPASPPAAPRSSSEQAPPSGFQRGALASFANEALIVLPVQALRSAVAAWSDKVGDQRAYLSAVDDEIAFAVRERGVKGQWAFPADLARSARRNPGYTADPYAIATDALAPVERDPDRIVGEPLAGQLRAFTGLFNARYALVPVDLRFVPDVEGGRATLHVVLIDTRAAHLIWKGDVPGDGTRNFTPAIAAGLASRVADLFTAAR